MSSNLKHCHKRSKRNSSYSREVIDKRKRYNIKQPHSKELPYIPDSKWEREEQCRDFNEIKKEPVSEELEKKPKIMLPDRNKCIKKEESEISRKEEKACINLGLSGKLTEDSNTYNGVVITYSQPLEARKPKRRWRWYIFKDDQDIPFLPLHRQSAYLIGRNRKVADIPIDHPSCSKQHAVLQYRLVSYTRTDGSSGRTVKPYIIDLESANGTYINTKRINAKQYFELFERDVVKFGFSSREYVLLHEGSKDNDADMVDSGPEISPISMLKS